MSEAGSKSLNALKQYSSALANGGESEALQNCSLEYRELWLPQKSYGHNHDGFLLQAQQGFNERGEIPSKRPSLAHPDKFDADLELAKIHLANEDGTMCRRAYMRSKANIMLKAYTSFSLFPKQQTAQRRGVAVERLQVALAQAKKSWRGC